MCIKSCTESIDLKSLLFVLISRTSDFCLSFVLSMTPPKIMTECARKAENLNFPIGKQNDKVVSKVKNPRANQRSKWLGIAGKVKTKKNKAQEKERFVSEPNWSPEQCDCDLLVQLAGEGWWLRLFWFLFLPQSPGTYSIFSSVGSHNLRNLCMQPMSVRITGNLRIDCRRCGP